MSKERPAPSTPLKTSLGDPKHLDNNDFTVMEGAVRAVEAYMATENAREAHLKIRVGFDLVPPEGKDYDYKSSSNLSIDISAVRNLPRARSDVLKKHEEEKKRLDAIRREKQEKCPTSTRSSMSSSCSSISDRTSMERQPAGGDDSESSKSTAPTSPFIEGAKSALQDTMLMGTPHEPVKWTKLPDTSTARAEETPEQVPPTQRAIAREIPSATVFAVKGAGGTAENAPPTPVRSANNSDAKSIAFSPASIIPSAIGSPIVQKRIEMVEIEERRKKKEDEEKKRKEEEDRKRREREEEERRRKKKEEDDNKIKDDMSSELSRESTSDASEFSNDYVPKPKRYRRRKKKCIHPISPSFSSHLQSLGSAASAAAAAAVERLRLSSGWITDLYYHYQLHILASLGRAFPGAEAPEPSPRRGQLPYPINRAIRRSIPSVEIFAVKHAANVAKKEEKKVEMIREVKNVVRKVSKKSKKEVKKESKKELKKEIKREIKKEVKKEVKKESKKKENNSVKTAPTQHSVKTAPTPLSVRTAPTQHSCVSPRKEQETTSKTAEEISSGRDTVSKRETEDLPPFTKSDDGLPSPIPTPTDQSIGFREVQSSKRSNVDSSYNKDEDTLNNIKSIDEDDCYTKRTESDTSIISNDPAHPEASFDFKKVGEKRTELSFQVLVHKNKIFSPIVLQPSRVVTVTNLSMEPL